MSRPRRRDGAEGHAGVCAGLLTLVVLATVQPALAAPPTTPQAASGPRAATDTAPRFEVALLGGRRAGGLLRVDTGAHIPLDVRDAGALGGRLAWRLDPVVTLQVEYSRQATMLARRREGTTAQPVADVTVEYLQAGPRFRLSRGAVSAYVALGVGLTRLRARDTGATDTFPSFQAGPGMLVPLSSHLALTGDLRIFASRVGANTGVHCQNPEAGCLRTGADTVLLQLQAFGGLSVLF